MPTRAELIKLMSKDMAKRRVEPRTETRASFIGPLSEGDTQDKARAAMPPNDPPIESEENPVELLAGVGGGAMMAKDIAKRTMGSLGDAMSKYVANRAASSAVPAVRSVVGDFHMPAARLGHMSQSELESLVPGYGTVSTEMHAPNWATHELGVSMSPTEMENMSTEEIVKRLAGQTSAPAGDSTKNLRPPRR